MIIFRSIKNKANNQIEKHAAFASAKKNTKKTTQLFPCAFVRALLVICICSVCNCGSIRKKESNNSPIFSKITYLKDLNVKYVVHFIRIWLSIMAGDSRSSNLRSPKNVTI